MDINPKGVDMLLVSSCIILGYDQFQTIDKKKMNQSKFRLTVLLAILGRDFYPVAANRHLSTLHPRT